MKTNRSSNAVVIPEWCSHKKQMCQLGNHHWSIARLIHLTEDFPVMDVPLLHLNIRITYGTLYIREMVMHMHAVMASDLSKPIILDEDGEVMDGRHRITKAVSLGYTTIKAVRFNKNPCPCKVEEDG